MIIGIIGAGASGMAAAISAAENPNNEVILFERQARVGRKLLSTGNGRCNLTNLNMSASHYHGEASEFVLPALEKFSAEETLQWFRCLGLYTVSEESGRVYPYSDQANSVVDVLRFALDKENICLKTGFEVVKVKHGSDGFMVSSKEKDCRCDRLIVACGGIAGTKLGGSLSGYKILQGFGHRLTRLRPSLVQLKSSWSGCGALKGVRANCRVAILHNGAVFAESAGELQFTEYGLSGPVIFEISRDVCHASGDWNCRLDLLPHEGVTALKEELQRRKQRALPIDELLTGMLHNRLGRVLTQAAGIRNAKTTGELTDGDIEGLRRVIKSFDVALTEPLGMDSAQVTAGGILTAEFNPETMESKLVPGLYACGEVLDIDGDCGGYNLQWAWSSGRMAGLDAGGTQK